MTDCVVLLLGFGRRERTVFLMYKLRRTSFIHLTSVWYLCVPSTALSAVGGASGCLSLVVEDLGSFLFCQYRLGKGL